MSKVHQDRVVAMQTYETSATVNDQGRVEVIGVPFAAGTEVQITICPKRQADAETTPQDDEALAAARERLRELFQTTKGFRNSPRIPREEIYERGSVR